MTLKAIFYSLLQRHKGKRPWDEGVGGSKLVYIHQGPLPLFCEIQTHHLILAIGSFPTEILEHTTKLYVQFHF